MDLGKSTGVFTEKVALFCGLILMAACIGNTEDIDMCKGGKYWYFGKTAEQQAAIQKKYDLAHFEMMLIRSKAEDRSKEEISLYSNKEG